MFPVDLGIRRIERTGGPHRARGAGGRSPAPGGRSRQDHPAGTGRFAPSPLPDLGPGPGMAAARPFTQVSTWLGRVPVRVAATLTAMAGLRTPAGRPNDVPSAQRT
jgi:hypothetical protein